MTPSSFRFLALTLVAFGVLAANKAQGGIPILITSGESIKHVGDVAPKLSAEIRQATGSNPSVGFHYSYFGVFWLGLWTWNGQYCFYNGNKYWLLSDAQAAAALDTTESQLHHPILYTFPPGLTVLIVVVAWGIAYDNSIRRKHRRQYEQDMALLRQAMSDSRYAEAVRLFAENQPDAARASGEASAQTPEQRFAAAVEYLASTGIPPTDADRSLRLVLAAAAARSKGEKQFEQLFPGLENQAPNAAQPDTGNGSQPNATLA